MLAKQIRVRRDKINTNDNRWIQGVDAKGSMDIQTAIDVVSERSGYEGHDRKDLERAIRLLIAKTPASVLKRCSIRLLKQGRYLSVNAGNHLLYRLPAYSDSGTKQDADAFVVWPASKLLSGWSLSDQDRIVAFRFRLFDAICLALDAQDILGFTSDDWGSFQSACEEALSCRKTRDWPSNVSIP